ncbi:MAG: beta-L-arabinofuranosidase domain-containing protein [Phycisphaerae bacterium]
MFNSNENLDTTPQATLLRISRFPVFLLFALTIPACTTTKVTTHDRLPADGCNSFYVGNRAPLLPSPLIKLPVGAVEPKGWLRSQLHFQAEGMVGHLAEISQWCNFAESAWVTPDGSGKWPWEEMPYWLKGYVDLGFVLRDPRIMAEATKWIQAILASQRPDGTFGPKDNFKNNDLWPHMCILYAMRSYYEATGDPQVISVMTNYFRYVQKIPHGQLYTWDKQYGAGWWQWIRAGDHLDSMYWLYNRTGEAWLLDLAEINHKQTADWTNGIASWHGVNIAECFREPGQYYVQSHDPKHLAAAARNYDEVRAKYGQVPGGMYGADENCREGFHDPRQGTETCAFVEMMHSHEILLKVSGDCLWADRCEEVAFNSFPPSLTPDLKGLHYLTCPNQIQCDRSNKAPMVENRGDMMSYTPYEQYRCCQHNVAFGWPYFVEHLWMATPDNGLAAAMYAPSKVSAMVGDGTKVTIDEKTDYPFDDVIDLTFSMAKSVEFPLTLRVPGWCKLAHIRINNQAQEPVSSRWVVYKRKWSDGDKVRIELPMEISTHVWTANRNSVSVSRGPLTYSLKIGEKWQEYDNGKPWAAYEVFSTTPWNYGLIVDFKDLTASFEFKRTGVRVGQQPFRPEAAPVMLKAKGKRIPEWQHEKNGLVGEVPESPVRSDQPVEELALIPMGCARLRIAAFPRIGDGPDAKIWKKPPPKPALTASHSNPTDSLQAVADGVIPKSSSDQSIRRFTWWPHRGTNEWIERALYEPQTIGSCEVYWFDDSDTGSFRVPKSWTIEYRPKGGGPWTSVKNTGPYGVAKDTFNKVSFEPVDAIEIRIRVELQPNYSGGILEWRIGD